MSEAERPHGLFALVDCNCFFASCERLFDPSLDGAPVAVLSGAEGCVICASPELKALGVKVGEPWFLAKAKPGMSAARAVNARFELYGDMSRRVMQALGRFGLPMSVYSIDEAFIELPAASLPEERAAWAKAAAKACRECGIPVSIGIGSTKTRAKLANSWAKPRAGGSGCFDIEALLGSDPAKLGALMRGCPCSEVWGVGPKSAFKLEGAGIGSAAELAAADLAELRKLGTIALARCGSELRGIREHALQAAPAAAQSLSRTRTFEKPSLTHKELAVAISEFAQGACADLRRSGSLAGKAEIFIGTHPMDRRGPARQAGAKLDLPTPTNDPLVVGSLAAEALRSIFKPGHPYRRAGITLSALRPDPELAAASGEPKSPPALLLADAASEWAPAPASPCAAAPLGPASSKRAGLLLALDGLRGKFGPGSIGMAGSLAQPGAAPRSRRPCPTTRLGDVPVAKA